MLMPRLFGLSCSHGVTPSKPCKVANAYVFLEGGVTAPMILFLMPKMVAWRPHSVKRQAHGSVSKPQKIMSFALFPSFALNTKSPPDRAGIAATMVPGFMYGANFSKYSPWAKEGTTSKITSANFATVGSFVISKGFPLSTLGGMSFSNGMIVNSKWSSPRAFFHLAASSAKNDTAMVLYQQLNMPAATCAALPPPQTNTVKSCLPEDEAGAEAFVAASSNRVSAMLMSGSFAFVATAFSRAS
mmetsp:Transcript_22733/g.37611  ORF Transcript_22733/g.37611 Transcript_22733/m.37611 type:complete len:243 (+) Transcript_22733:732-1460(+)